MFDRVCVTTAAICALGFLTLNLTRMYRKSKRERKLAEDNLRWAQQEKLREAITKIVNIIVPDNELKLKLEDEWD